MRNINIREARLEDIEALKNRIRKQDAEEVIASGYSSVEDSLAKSFARSTLCYTVELEGLQVGLFGCVPDTILGPSANVWFLGAEELGQMKKSFVKLSRQVIAEFLLQYSCLWNLVDSRYVKAIRWLQAIGAVFQTEPIMQNGIPFYAFVIRRGA